MIDITLIGGGPNLVASSEVLSRAGFMVTRAADLESGDRSPIILGESPGAFSIARSAIEAGRHLLIANPSCLPAERLRLLFSERKSAQSLFLWNERRYHPGYKLVNGLIESDSTWRPRYLRQETFGLEPTTSQLIRWRALESISLLLGIAGELPVSVAASAIDNPMRSAPDLLSLTIGFRRLTAFLQVAQGEAIERRETLLAAASRKAYVDELHEGMPLRLVEDEAKSRLGEDRWLACPTPDVLELARLQCLSFLDATLDSNLAQAEARLWSRALATLAAMDHSLDENGSPVEVEAPEERGRFRLILGRAATHPPSIA